jgi:hypothetical protein
VVEHLPHDPKIDGLNPPACSGTGREISKEVFLFLGSSSIVVVLSSRHPKVKSLNLSAAAGTKRENGKKLH